MTAAASALAHGYAHYIAERAPHRRWDALRTLRDEWPLVAAALPTVFLLAGAGWGWWPANGVEYAAFVLNIALLFCLAWSPPAGRRGVGSRPWSSGRWTRRWVWWSWWPTP